MKNEFICEENEKFVVTGASSGIGKAVSVLLAHSGAAVIGIARNKERLEETMHSLEGNHYSLSLDVSDHDALYKRVRKFGKDMGPYSGCVHCAGINNFTPLRGFDMAKAEEIVKVSLWSGVTLVRALAHKSVLSKKGASCVLASSVTALEGRTGLTAYCAAKTAVLGACRSMAKELAAKKIRVNAVCPGWVESPMTRKMADLYPGGIEAVEKEHPLGIGQPSQVASAILFLLSDHANWITGTALVVDGGYMA